MTDLPENGVEPTGPSQQRRGRARVFLSAGILVGAVVLWHLAALLLMWGRGGVNDDSTPDRYETFTAAEYADMGWGLRSAPAPLVLEYGKAVSDRPIVRVVRSYRDEQTRKWVELEVQMGERVDPLSVPYERVTWETSANPGVMITFDDAPVRLGMIGSGYDYKRFILMRGAERYSYLPGNAGDTYDPYNNPAMFIEDHATKMRIMMPDEPAWQQVKTIG